MTVLLVVAHCLLNPGTRLKGLKSANFDHDVEAPLIQLPCPEAGYLGLERWAVTKNQLDVSNYRRYCREVILHQADLIEQFFRQGSKIKVVGVAGSPNCGVESTTLGYHGGRVWAEPHKHVSGRGIFMEEVHRELVLRGVKFQFVEVGENKVED